MGNLPHDVIVDVLSRVPAKSLLQFRCVSKPWCSLIDDPDFARKHIKLATQHNQVSLIIKDLVSNDLKSIDDNTSFDKAINTDYPFWSPQHYLEILGSCDGLLCIIDEPISDYIHYLEDTLFLLNPCNREFKQLPPIPSNFTHPGVTSYNLCFDHTINDYKVVNLGTWTNDITLTGVFEVKVFTLGTNSWRQIQVKQDYTDCVVGRWGVHVNGALHWMAQHTFFDEPEVKDFVLAFNLVNETLTDVKVPFLCNDNYYECGVLGGCLSILCHYDLQNHYEVWVMTDYGIQDSWTKLHTISHPSCYPLMPICFSKAGEILLEDQKDLFVYDLKCHTARKLEVRGIPNTFVAKAYVGSLVSLKSGRQEQVTRN